MIEAKVNNGECECNVDGDPIVLLSELVQIEKTVVTQICEDNLMDLVSFGIACLSLSENSGKGGEE